MTTPKTLHLHTFRNGYHVALDDTTNIPTYPMQYVVSFRTPDQQGQWAGPYTRQGFFLSYVNAKEYFDFVIEAYEKDLASLEEQERRHNAAIDQYRAMRRATAHFSEQEQQQAINDFRCGKYNEQEQQPINKNTMKRDIHQEMTEAANKYAQSITDAAGVQSMLSIAFCEGVRWADENPKTSTLAEASRKKENELRTQMRYEDHRSDKTLYGQFQELLNTLGAMTGCSDYLRFSQHIKEKKATFGVRLAIDKDGTINIELELIKDPE